MFLDEYECTLVGGTGGAGCCSFRREKYAPKGGPDGGDGGNAGAVVFMPTIHRNTLYHLGGSRTYAAVKGRQGTSSDCAGGKGEHGPTESGWNRAGDLTKDRLYDPFRQPASADDSRGGRLTC